MSSSGAVVVAVVDNELDSVEGMRRELGNVVGDDECIDCVKAFLSVSLVRDLKIQAERKSSQNGRDESSKSHAESVWRRGFPRPFLGIKFQVSGRGLCQGINHIILLGLSQMISPGFLQLALQNLAKDRLGFLQHSVWY